jgi:hypothetical protein
MDSKELKVFKMNEYEWWVTDGYAEDLNDWYNEHVEDNNIYDVQLCDIDKEGMWYMTDDPMDFETLGDADESISYNIVNGQKRTQFGSLMRRYDEIYKLVPFREVLTKQPTYTEPYCIASTEW